MAFAFAVPNGRTTQVFINLRNNAETLDAQGFAPFGRVVEGMDVVDALNAEYGESAGGGHRRWRPGHRSLYGHASVLPPYVLSFRQLNAE